MKSSLSSKKQLVKIVPPDPVCSSTLDSIRQNPKFARLLGFSINNLYDLLRRLNPKHRINAYYIIQERGHVNLIQALNFHRKNEVLVCIIIQCLLRLINTNKQFSDEYCYKLIEAGAPQALHDLISTASRNAESMKLAMPFIAQLAASRSNVSQLIEVGLMHDCVDIIKDPKIGQETSREAVETLLKFIHYPQARKELIHPDFVKNIIDLLENRIRDRFSILAGLKILFSIVITHEGYELLKQDLVGIRIIVKVLENHPQDKLINEIAGAILEKLATIEHIEKALSAVKAGNTSQIPVLSSLLLVDDLLRYVIQKGGILELIHILDSQLNQDKPESLVLAKSCVTALGRIAIHDSRYIQDIFDKGGLEIINKACQKENPELLQACCDTVQKFAVDEPTTEQIIAKETVRALLDRFESVKKTESIGASIIESLGALGKHPAGRREIEHQNGPRKILKVMKEYKNNKEIQESGLKALSKLITNPSTAMILVEEDIIDHMAQVTKAHLDWKKTHFYAMKVFEAICVLGQNSPKIEKKKVFEAVITIVTTGILQEEVIQHIKNSELVINTERDDIIKVEEKLTDLQEFELRNAAVAVLESISHIEDLQALHLVLEETSNAFSKEHGVNAAKTLQQLRLFATIALIPKVAEFLCDNHVHEKIAWNSRMAASQQSFKERADIIKTCVMFFEHLTHHHIHHEHMRELLTHENVKRAALDTLMNSFNRDTEERIVLQAFKGLKTLITNRVLLPEDKFVSDEDTRSGHREASTEKVIGAVISIIKKFEEERVQFAGIGLLIAAINTDKAFIPLIINQGGTRLAISHLENINTSIEAGKLNMELINCLSKDPEALRLLKNQHASQAIWFFLSANHNPEDVAQSASPILQTLAPELTEGDLAEIIDVLKEGTTEADRLTLVDTFEYLANLTLLDRNNELLIKHHAPQVLLSLLERELAADVETLIAGGNLESHKRILIALLSSLSRMRTTQTTIDQDLVQHGLFANLDKTIKTRSDLAQAIAHALHLLAQLSRNNLVDTEIVKNCVDADIVPALVGFLESYKNDESIMNSATDLLLAISNKYPDLVAKMGQKSFVRALIKETAVAVKVGKENPNAMAQASQNFKCLVTMSENPVTLRAVIDEGGESLAVSVVEKYIRKSKQGQAKRERAASIRPGQALMDVNAAIGSHHSIADVMVASALELLDRILEIPIGQRAAVHSSLAKELVNVLEDNTDPNMILSALRIIEKASRHEQLVPDLSETSSLMKIMKAATIIPNTAELERIMGRILTNLGTASMIPIIAEQIIEYSQKLDMNDTETMEPYFNALSYYANLLSTPKDVNVEGNTGAKVNEAILGTLQVVRANPALIFAHARVLERLVSRDTEIRRHIRHSPAAEVLVHLLSTVRTDLPNKQRTFILTKAVKEISNRDNRDEIIIDGTTGQRKLRPETQDAYIHSFLQNNGQSIKNLVELLDLVNKRSHDEQVNQDSIGNALTILNEVARESAQARAEIIRLNGIAIVSQLYCQRIPSQSHKEEARESLRLLAVLTEDRTAYSTVATEALLEKLIRDISEPEFERMIEGEDEPNLTEGGLAVLQSLADIEHDHTLLKEKACLETVLGIIESFKVATKLVLAAKRFTPGVLRACRTASQAMRALRSMLTDPVLAKNAIRAQAKETIISVLDILAGTTPSSKNIDTERLKQVQDIVSSQNPFNRLVEDTLGVIQELSIHLRHEKGIDFLGEDGNLYQDLLNLMSKIPDESLATYRALGIFKHALQHLGKVKILQHKETLFPVGEVADHLLNLYPSVPIIVDLAGDVKSLAIVGLTIAEVQNIRADLDSLEKAKKDFIVLSNLVEDLVPREVSQSITHDERLKLVEVFKIVKDISEDEERAGKIEQHELLYFLAETLIHPHIDLLLKEIAVEVFARLSKQPDQCVKLAASAHVLHALATYIKVIGVQVLNSSADDSSYEVSQVVSATETLERLIEVAKLTFQLPREVNLNTVTSGVCHIVEPACGRQDPTIVASVVRILAVLSLLNEEAGNTVESSGATGKFMQRAERSSQSLKFARNFALFVATTASTPQRRTDYAKYGVFEKLRDATRAHPDDLELNISTCFAYTSLVLGHPENGRLFLNSEAIQYLEYLIHKHSNEPVIVENISRLLSTLASNNPENVHRLGEVGAVKWIGIFFSTFHERTPETIVIECLKTVNNLNTSKENASRLVDQGFIGTLIKYITKHSASSLVGILVMSVIGHLAVHNDTSRVYRAIEQGAIEAIVKISNTHQTDKTILLSGLDNLKHFMRDSRCSQQLSQRGAIEMIMRILTTQDYDTDLVLKALNLFEDMLINEDAINLTLESDIVTVLNGLLTTQRTAPEVLDTVFRVFAKLATDQDRSLRVYQTGFLQAALRCVEGHAIRPSTTFELFKTLYKLSHNEDVAGYIGEASTATILKQIENNINNKIIAEIGAKLLVNLLENELSANIAVSHRAVEIMNTMIQTHPQDEVISLLAFHALSLLAVHSDRARPELLGSSLKSNIESLHTSFAGSNKAEPTHQARMALENIERASSISLDRSQSHLEEESPELKKSHVKQYEPEKVNFVSELDTSTSTSPVHHHAPVEEQKLEKKQSQVLSRQTTTMEKRNERLTAIKNDPEMKEAWSYLFRGKILKMWTPHGTSWPMHLLLSDDGYALTLKGKKKWETTIRLDDIEGIWKGYFSNSPFTKPKKLFTKSPDQDYCFFFVTHPSQEGAVKTLYFECNNVDEREKFVDYLVQILKRLINMQKEGKA